ncbi:MAG: hypothetical protein ABFS23_01525 [Pseudomonadota bacterium]
MKKHFGYIFLLMLAPIYAAADDLAVGNDIDQLVSESERVANEIASRAWDIPGDIQMLASHSCDQFLTSDELCIVPFPIVETPAAYVAFFCSISQQYKVFFVVSDVSGSVKAFDTAIIDGSGCNDDILDMKITSSSLSNLPEGEYDLTTFIVGQTDLKRALGRPYHFFTF